MDVYPEISGGIIQDVTKENQELTTQKTELERRINQLRVLGKPIPPKLANELKAIHKKILHNSKLIADMDKKKYYRTIPKK